MIPLLWVEIVKKTTDTGFVAVAFSQTAAWRATATFDRLESGRHIITDLRLHHVAGYSAQASDPLGSRMREEAREYLYDRLG